jgi:hypothetical protein
VEGKDQRKGRVFPEWVHDRDMRSSNCNTASPSHDPSCLLFCLHQFMSIKESAFDEYAREY